MDWFWRSLRSISVAHFFAQNNSGQKLLKEATFFVSKPIWSRYEFYFLPHPQGLLPTFWRVTWVSWQVWTIIWQDGSKTSSNVPCWADNSTPKVENAKIAFVDQDARLLQRLPFGGIHSCIGSPLGGMRRLDALGGFNFCTKPIIHHTPFYYTLIFRNWDN